MQTKRRFAKCWKAICAAAPAITTSSRQCSRVLPRWPSRNGGSTMGANDAGYIGQSVKRKEDARFLTGTGQYTDDVALPNQTYGYFLRSPHAHAKIRSIDTGKAKGAPGVIAVYTGADLEGVNGLPCGWLITSVDGTPMKEPPHHVLAKGKVRYVGDHRAMIVREDR